MSVLKKKIENKEFVITSEITPPKGVDCSASLKKIKGLENKLDAVNATDQQSSVMSMGSAVMSYFLLQNGFEPIYQVTCRDRNRIALESDLLSAYALGIRNVLVLTGDHPKLGDHPHAKPVYDLDSVQLLEVISKLEKGRDMCDNKLNNAPEFFKGAVVNPGVSPLEPEIIKMEKKIKSGAAFFQTQAVYDLKKFEKFLKKVQNYNVPIIAGIIPLKSKKMADYLNNNVAGIHIPENYLNRLKKFNDFAEGSVQLTKEFIKNLKGMVQGVHIMPIKWGNVLFEIL